MLGAGRELNGGDGVVWRVLGVRVRIWGGCWGTEMAGTDGFTFFGKRGIIVLGSTGRGLFRPALDNRIRR